MISIEVVGRVDFAAFVADRVIRVSHELGPACSVVSATALFWCPEVCSSDSLLTFNFTFASFMAFFSFSTRSLAFLSAFRLVWMSGDRVLTLSTFAPADPFGTNFPSDPVKISFILEDGLNSSTGWSWNSWLTTSWGTSATSFLCSVLFPTFTVCLVSLVTLFGLLENLESHPLLFRLDSTTNLLTFRLHFLVCSFMNLRSSWLFLLRPQVLAVSYSARSSASNLFVPNACSSMFFTIVTRVASGFSKLRQLVNWFRGFCPVIFSNGDICIAGFSENLRTLLALLKACFRSLFSSRNGLMYDSKVRNFVISCFWKLTHCQLLYCWADRYFRKLLLRFLVHCPNCTFYRPMQMAISKSCQPLEQ